MLGRFFPTLAGTVLLASLAGAAAALAGEDAPPRPTLRAQAGILGEIVRIGDLVDNAGAAADIAIFRAPDLGQTGAVATAQVLDALRAHHLVEIDAQGLREVSVTRLSRRLEPKDIEARIARAFAGQQGLGAAEDLAITFDREPRALEIDPAAGEPRLARASYDVSSRRFDLSFELPGAGTARRPAWRFTGTLLETAQTATLARPINRGEVIRASDVALERKPKALLGDTALRSPEQVIGLAARRGLQAGQPLRALDLMKPEAVHANETVTIVYEVPGMALTVRGKALESGAEGDLVNVVNAQSKRTVQGTVTGLARVSVAPAAPRVIGNEAAAAPRPVRPASLAAAAPLRNE